MENTPVTMSMGDVVVVKDEERDSTDGTKTQVILQLQPVHQGMCEDSAETDAAVVSVETHTDEVSVDGEEVEIGYPITCGESKAVLLWKKFVCPGINVKCVKYNDQLISPKQFVHLAGKATLKDWKRAIRLEGIMLRKMMDSGQIDFYQHEHVCTNTCRSTKFDLLINNTRFPLQMTSMVQTPNSPQAISLYIGNGGQITVSEESQEEGMDWNQGMTSSIPTSTEQEAKKDTDDISEETLSFWKGIADVGLMGEVVTNIRTELLALLRGVQQRSGQATLQEPDAAVLNNLAQIFGLLDTVKTTLDNRRSQTDQSQEQIHSTLTDLARQLEEQKKQTRDWRVQSQPVQNLMLMSLGTPSKPPPKRPRLHRPASTTSTPLQQTQGQQFTVLSPITISSMGQPFTMGGLPVHTLAQQSSPITLHTLPAGSQFFTRYTTATVVPGSQGKGLPQETITFHPSASLTLLSTTAVQDPSQLVSPVELVEVEQEQAAQEEEGLVEGGGEVVLQEEGHVIGEEEEEEEMQTQTHTVIEIDPDSPNHIHHPTVMNIELEEGTEVEDRVEVQGELEMGEATVHMEHQEQLHDVQIVVIEEEASEDHETKDTNEGQ
ncbi:glucocorticoid modulatory element-binding protein 1-like isoform X1 [Acipenser ruthenus]|uniref:glucocorticoid modulatory element-binding protein 1-like isoform X1 n=1 Tax=Acipenser ruthenus TaxID=7906 RepID=UPI00145B00E9|nr:glucocorticoid modulatory element-binding protein 1-like isoform X1 [Acipenser ruthenus]XP_058853634.1 glucocorticoid modulatory element-binding protein 1-like isoform X1 [Acipenser ruthenus]XP_058853635.1 glucocorticoid modulatory element-binding protein 1-like isoform X1 [Acipenser ruthenus]XP_058853636.1 glucocorticoid modulatory element-binding protein 1-like isoform X1 [Acipenser ruthenus]